MAVRFCFFLIYLVEGVTIYQYCSKLFDSTCAKWLNTLVLSLLYMLLFILSNFNITLINVVAFFLCNVSYMLMIYRVSLSQAFLHSAISTSIMTVCEAIVSFLAPYEYSLPFTSWESFQDWVIPGIFEKSLYFILMTLFAHFSEKGDSSQRRLIKSSFLLTAISAASVFIMCTFMFIRVETKLSNSLYILVTVSTLLLLLLNIFTWEVFNYIQKKDSELTNMQLTKQKETDLLAYYKMAIQQSENQRQLIHDIKSHLQSIAILNHNGEQDKVDAYIESIIHSSSLKSSVRICDNDFLNAILCRYACICQDIGITFLTDIRSQSVAFLAEQDLTSLFCNLLDNAVETASLIPDGRIELAVHQQENTSFTVITLENSCRQNPFLPGSTKLKTTKPNPSQHGFGMKIIKNVADRYSGETKYYYDAEKYIFHSIIILRTPTISESIV